MGHDQGHRGAGHRRLKPIKPFRYIRFVGGPLHNQHRRVRWHDTLPASTAARRVIGAGVYHLIVMESIWGAVYFEYHFNNEVRYYEEPDFPLPAFFFSEFMQDVIDVALTNRMRLCPFV